MNSYQTILLNVDELWLKGKNRPLYFKAAKQHIKDVVRLSHSTSTQLKNDNQRLVLRSGEPFSDKTIEHLERIPGLHSICPVRDCEADIDKICEVAISEMKEMIQSPATFKVETKRTNKKFPMNSMEISRTVGGALLKNNDFLKVDVHNPEHIVRVKITSDGAYVGVRDRKGVGGLPVGMTGRLLTLLSGGFDSPVASYQMAKRGCRQDFVFFYAYPFVGEEVKEKITQIAGVLGSYLQSSRLYIVPFGHVQNEIAKVCREEYRTIFFRKLMVEASNLLADKTGADALLTGDALGQVSSQTIGNITLMDQITRRPIFRPLLGNNKQEILSLARKIRTHDISIIPHDDACSLFAPKHPVIKPDKIYWDQFNKQNQFSDALSKAITEAEVIHFNALGK